MSELVELCAWWSINNVKRDQEQAEEFWNYSKWLEIPAVFSAKCVKLIFLTFLKHKYPIQC